MIFYGFANRKIHRKIRKVKISSILDTNYTIWVIGITLNVNIFDYSQL